MGLQVLVHKYYASRRDSKKHGEKSALAFYNSHPICPILFICQLSGLFEDQVVDCPLLAAVELLVLVEVENEELTMVNSAIIFKFLLITALADTDDTLAVVFDKAVIVFVKMNVLMLVPRKIFIFLVPPREKKLRLGNVVGVAWMCKVPLDCHAEAVAVSVRWIYWVKQSSCSNASKC